MEEEIERRRIRGWMEEVIGWREEVGRRFLQ